MNTDASQVADVIAIAREMHDDIAKIEDDAIVKQEQGGCWVQAWVWVENVYIEPES